MHMEHPDGPFSRVLFNRFEWQDADEGSAQAWEMSAWLGGDLNRVWLRSEGEREGGSTHSADIELLYGRSIGPWWDVVAGVRQEFQPGPARTWAAVGVQGLAPYRFEVQATALFGAAGRTAAAVEVEYEMLLTNRLILQPLLEIEFHGRDDRARGIGSGLSSIEGGLRLRYEISRRFAPYLGVTRERAIGRTADLRRGAGADIDETRLVAGVRWWF
ncbi:copper resistance protein B [Luteimonas salinisoli]|nr:copper resistance protein B [Luteimonas salinisoli]